MITMHLLDNGHPSGLPVHPPARPPGQSTYVKSPNSTSPSFICIQLMGSHGNGITSCHCHLSTLSMHGVWDEH